MNIYKLGCAIALVLSWPPVQAQVFKCKSASGQVVYSDSPCPAGTAGQQLQRQRTFEEIQDERSQAWEAENRKRAKQRSEAAQEAAAKAQVSASQSAPDTAASKHKGYAQRLAERNAVTNSNLVPYHARVPSKRQRVEEAESPQVPESFPTNNRIHRCTGSVCDDWNGNRYSQDPSGSGFTSTDGKKCTAVFGEMRC
ncbi:DUF4124 domain-containing protein [Acidovorax sp. SUPP2539]|uniref:DUF4124 domain-containing protein n=1 Tax=Acidovorax sp. SUPP2539 TaxID=2920878 RepID=UPI0023DE462E|nr:DUF4124 domain-containing protein [Acidovorax sp. SUPP2539]GKS91230.1 DUF4124 domain-containing protein [Acidovorax sp. SUPP2539]